jgi:hypothetical protein
VVNTRDGTHGSETNYDAIARAVNGVQDAGFYDRPLTVAAHPDSLFRTRTAKGSTSGDYLEADAVLPDVKAWLPATTVSAGQAIAGDFSVVKLFIGGGVNVQFTNNYQDYLTRGLVRGRIATFAYLWVSQPAGLCEVTAL